MIDRIAMRPVVPLFWNSTAIALSEIKSPYDDREPFGCHSWDDGMGLKPSCPACRYGALKRLKNDDAKVICGECRRTHSVTLMQRIGVLPMTW